MASLKRFELPTHGLEGRCSILLSYRLIAFAEVEDERFELRTSSVRPSKTVMERVMGIGPTQSAWKADILPLNYTRTDSNRTFERAIYNSMLDNITTSAYLCQQNLD